MKKILKPLFCAAALVLLAGCNKFDEANATPENSNGSLIKVYANVAENDGTRANINVGESVFTAEWEAGAALGILPVKTGGTAPATAAKFDYNTASAAFEGSLNDFVAGGGNYYAFFPHAQVTGTTANLPFGNLRTQTGNDFNSAYDALVATPQAYGAADEAGKVDGNPVAFTLHRLTSVERSDYGSRVRTLAASRREEVFLVHVRDKIIPLHRSRIAYCYTSNEKVTAYGFDGAAYPLDKTLEALQGLLPESEFFRANRQFIVARQAVKEIAVWFGSRLTLHLTVETPERIVISKARVPEFKAWLRSLHPVE